MSTQWLQIAAVAAVVTIGASVLAVAQSAQKQGDTFTWSGELVSFDATAKSMTVKSRVAYQEAISELKHFKAGDRIWVVWSGNHDYSANGTATDIIMAMVRIIPRAVCEKFMSFSSSPGMGKCP